MHVVESSKKVNSISSAQDEVTSSWNIWTAIEKRDREKWMRGTKAQVELVTEGYGGVRPYMSDGLCRIVEDGEQNNKHEKRNHVRLDLPERIAWSLLHPEHSTLCRFSSVFLG